MGLSFKETYPQDYQNYASANKRYNWVEAELKDLYDKVNTDEKHRFAEETL